MKREVAILWAEALESGEYKQTSGKLRDNAADTPEYCCLGVLCDIAPVGEWAGNRDVYGIVGDYDAGLLPNVVGTWAGVDHGNFSNVLLVDTCGGNCEWDGTPPGFASHMNDSHHWSFQQIAHAIRVRYAPDTVAVPDAQ